MTVPSIGLRIIRGLKSCYNTCAHGTESARPTEAQRRHSTLGTPGMVALSPDAANVVDWALHALIIALWVVSECNAILCAAIAAVHYSVSAGWRWQLGGAYSGLCLAACGWSASAAILSAAGIAIGLLFPVPVIHGIPGAHDVGFLDYEVRWSLLTAPYAHLSDRVMHSRLKPSQE